MSMCPRVRGPVLRVVHMGRKKPLFAVLLEDVRSENMFWGEIHPVCVGGELLRAGQAYENDTRCQPDTANDCDMADFSAVTRSKMSHGWRPWNPSPPSPKKTWTLRNLPKSTCKKPESQYGPTSELNSEQPAPRTRLRRGTLQADLRQLGAAQRSMGLLCGFWVINMKLS